MPRPPGSGQFFPSLCAADGRGRDRWKPTETTDGGINVWLGILAGPLRS